LKTNRRGRLRLAGLVAGTAAAILVGAYVHSPVAAADVGGSFATTTNASDPFVMRCTDEGVQGLCMYTSQDMGITANLPPDNPYPMQNTRGFFSSDGGRTWADRGYVFSEDQIPWVPANPNDPSQKALHLWAPAAWQDPETGFTYLYVPDVANASLPAQNNPLAPNVHTSSRIAVAFGFSPFGPFGYLGSVADPNGNVPGYMSDPEPFSDSTGRYLLWANGDGDTCGGLSVGTFQANGIHVSNIAEITINNFPTDWGTCTRKAPFTGTVNNRPYLEGPSLLKFSDLTTRTGLPGPYTLVFAAKPSDEPGECQNFGQPNTANEVIAYATSSSVGGPYAYQGILMCGSSTEWTNQATIVEVTMANGAKRMVLIYHDGPPGTHHRKLHAECLWFGAGTFAMANRSSTGFTDCMNGANANAWAFRSRVFPPGLPQNVVNAFGVFSTQPSDFTGNGRIYANRAAVSPWEIFDVRNSSGAIVSPEIGGTILRNASLLAHANNRVVTSEGVGTGALIANRTSVGPWERFRLNINGLGGVSFASEASGLEVTTHASGRTLRPTNPARAPDEFFDLLHL
jgi:hypothetical protein